MLTLLLWSDYCYSQKPVIEVRYPRKGQVLPFVDSTFIFGKVTPGSTLEVNGVSAEVHKDGGFLAFVDVDPGEFEFQLRADMNGLGSTLTWPVRISELYRTVPSDSLAILPRFSVPYVYQELTPGDLVEVSFRGTPGGRATFSIEGVIDSVPMVENGKTYGGSWGERVFGDGEKDDTTCLAGVYFGSVYLPDTADVDSAHVTFRLEVPASRFPDPRLNGGPAGVAIAESLMAVVEDTAKGLIMVRSYSQPQVVELIDSTQTIRTGPRKGYLSIFQPKGVRFVCDGRYGNYLRLRLAPGQTAWIPDTSVTFLAPGTPVPHSYVRTVRCTGLDDTVRVEIFLDEKLPFQVATQDSDNSVLLRVFGATSDTDWIRYLGSRDHIDRIVWRQEQDRVYLLTIDLEETNFWGWDGRFVDNVLTLELYPGPEKFGSYKDLRVMIDPGHSKDPGAIGPTGLLEAEANLWIADKLSEILRKKGATVFMTRHDDSDVKLYDRPKLAREKNCDVFISVHNNSVPDGVNPLYHNGVSTYYYNAFSKPLAEHIQKRAVERLHLRDHGLYYANFAVTRPTQYLAVLIECTFMILPDQEAALRTESFQEKCAKTIAEGLDDYLRSLDRRR